MKKNKLVKLRKELTINNIDGYIIPKNDEFFGEYVSPEKERLKYLTVRPCRQYFCCCKAVFFH